MMHDQLPTDADRQKAKELRAKHTVNPASLTGPEWTLLHRLEQWIVEADAPPQPKPQPFKFIGR
jgi:hypothetical protein